MQGASQEGSNAIAEGLVDKYAYTVRCRPQRYPIQVPVNAIVNNGPREYSMSVGFAVPDVRRQTVDVDESPLRSVNQAIFPSYHWYLRVNIKSIAECLNDELINAAKGSPNSYVIKTLESAFHNVKSIAERQAAFNSVRPATALGAASSTSTFTGEHLGGPGWTNMA